ncbi:MAG: 2-oxoglutarate dehydrogenase complex dihydrolipoyllysine-residue succinyltransferase [Bacteroidales bacterium]|nr:2-oxoglutarate dehydrogenase complex dihydrolipoyllysine-residue succinyltransferase [Bacteroidales bacterium]
MIVEITIPSPGESVSEVEIAQWHVKTGDFVEKDQELAEIESEKATLPLIASESGEIEIILEPGTAKVGAVACKIDTTKAGKTSPEEVGKKMEIKPETKQNVQSKALKITPLAKAIIAENGLKSNDISAKGEKIRKEDVEKHLSGNKAVNKAETSRGEERRKLSPLRKKVSERLVGVKNQTAMLTTFNEVDMSNLIILRNKQKEEFQKKYGVKLGFMSFFTKAASMALLEFQEVNSMIDGDEIVYHPYTDIGIAVQTEKGLMVPVVRDVQNMQIGEIELKIAELASKAREKKISLDELTGGTFTISNGGVFGSMLSTPILNPPQSAILGMHNISDRPVAINGKVEIRPIMYLALSYDHRIIDGRDSVGFLKKIKELIENPEMPGDL